MNQQHHERKRKWNEQLGGLTVKQIRVIMAGRDAAIQERDLTIAQKNAAVAEKDIVIEELSLAIAEREIAIEERSLAIAEKNVAVAERLQAILRKDAAIAGQNIDKMEKECLCIALWHHCTLQPHLTPSVWGVEGTAGLRGSGLSSYQQPGKWNPRESRTIKRDKPPTHFQLRIKSFSLLSKSSLERYNSGNFEAGGYKWKLCLYPKGNKDANGEEGRLPLYLEISERDTLSPGWEVHPLFRLFLLDQHRDKYLILQDASGNGNGKARRLHASRTQPGFDRFITLKEFNDPTNGYLVNDTSVFGAEIIVHRECVAGKGECLLVTARPVSCNHIWKIEKFSELANELHSSEVFSACGHKWYQLTYASTIFTPHTTYQLKSEVSELFRLLI
ncbi:uncharacterized protein LOC122084195 [Macadamia integrifolia]|uniref:uncharacterized protein LOC122084195 n=1 Tax=Macadamia integrifolia TaxID=60698 RepID=UPI001C4E85BB|nr:uncharacterized protein LOC122084195 [Macadamia integrifolia]